MRKCQAPLNFCAEIAYFLHLIHFVGILHISITICNFYFDVFSDMHLDASFVTYDADHFSANVHIVKQCFEFSSLTCHWVLLLSSD